jgi:hypothetical protein
MNRRILNKQKPPQKKVTFTYVNPATRKITNIYRGTQIHITFKPINIISQYIKEQHISDQQTRQKRGI